MTNLTVKGHRFVVRDFYNGNPPKALILINRNEKVGPELTEVMGSCPHILLCFDDIELPRFARNVCTEQHISDAIKWAADKDDVVVSCTVGVSRSPAIAYAIAAAQRGHQEAMAVLNPKLHMPNSLIIRLTAVLLKQPEIVTLVETWKMNNIISDGAIF